METVKLTQQELEKIEQLQTSFTQAINSLGLIHYQILDLQTRKEQVEQELAAIAAEERTIYDQLVATYGEGMLSLETGEFVKS